MAPNYLRHDVVKIGLQWMALAVASLTAGLVLSTLQARGVSTETGYLIALGCLFVLGFSSWLAIARKFPVQEQRCVVMTWSPDSLPVAAVAGIVIVLSLPLPRPPVPAQSSIAGPILVFTINSQPAQCNSEEPTLTRS
jgi:hypothetical protein